MEYVPRNQLAERLAAGWRLVIGVNYQPSEWAILMAIPARATEVDAAAILRFFTVKRPRIARNQRWCRHGHVVERGIRECKVCRAARDKAAYQARKAVLA